MKRRLGFVSNSSTTSFTCEICGETWSGWDSVSMEDIGFWRCVNGHEICENHILDEDVELTNRQKYDMMLAGYRAESYYTSTVEELEAIEDPENWEECDEWWEDFIADLGNPECYCPVCQFMEISNSDTAKYLEKVTGVSRDEAFAWVKGMNRRRKKLYNTEYVMYVCQQTGRDITFLPQELKERFGTYRAFQEWLREN